MKHIADILKGVVAGLLLLGLASLKPGRYLPALRQYDRPIEMNAVSLLFFILGLLLVLIWLFVSRRPLSVKNGRSGAMVANVHLLKRRAPRNRRDRYILSTRISFWPVSEQDVARVEFRTLLTRQIEDGIVVKRIWQIYGIEDLRRLAMYVEQYKNRDNYSVRCFVGACPFIPEILSVYGEVASVSIPQPEDPRKLTTTFHFRGTREISRWEGYFELLWDQSIPIKTGAEIHYDRLASVKETVGGRDHYEPS